MIILHANREIKKEVIELDEIELSKKLYDDVVIIPSCYDLISMDDTYEVGEVERENISKDICKALKMLQEAIEGFRV